MSTPDAGGARPDRVPPAPPPTPAAAPDGFAPPSGPFGPFGSLGPSGPSGPSGPFDERVVGLLAQEAYAEEFRPPAAPKPTAGDVAASPAPDGESPLYFVPAGAAGGAPPACSADPDLSTSLLTRAQAIPFTLGPAAPSSPTETEAPRPPGVPAALPLPTDAADVREVLTGTVPAEPASSHSSHVSDYYFNPSPNLPSAAPASPASAARAPGAGAAAEFPALDQQVNGHRLVWLDNAATTQKPRAVIAAVSRFYERDNSNIHRGAHALARRATDAYESARETVRRFLGAPAAEEVVFVRGTTEAINLVAQSWGRANVGAGDEILLTTLEHHANIVPWQMLAREKGATLRVAPITDRGEVVLEEYARLLGPRTRLVGFPHVSNALGTVLPVREMAEMAHRRGARVLVDGAQSVPHLRADVAEIGADFFAFSGHKVFGPTGVGVLWARRDAMEEMPPWQGGGSMIRDVTFETTTYADPPAKYEAGTPTVADAVGLAAAIEYLERLGIENVARHEHALLEYGTKRLAEVPGLRPIGTAPNKASVLSFVIEGTRPEDVGRHLDAHGIAVRAGHHCAMPTMRRYGLTGTVRPSLALYNTREDLDALVEALLRLRRG